MFGWGERQRLRDKVESQAAVIVELRAGISRLLRERDAADEKFRIASEALAEARSRLKEAPSRQGAKKV